MSPAYSRYEPKHRVTTQPIALIVGPRCTSSCDALAQIFDSHNFGPLIGDTTAASYTAYRLQWPVKLPSGKDFGFIELAFSDDIDGASRRSLEAVPLSIDRPVERTWDNQAQYDRLLVDAAIDELSSRSSTIGTPQKRKR